MKQYTVPQFAKKNKVDARTVYRWVKKKTLPTGATGKVFLTRLYIETNED